MARYAAFVLCALAAAVVPMPSAAAARVVRAGGLSIAVPADWPVIRVGGGSPACVRFDRHAVYVGVPGVEQRCPAGAAGHTEAILVEPNHAGGVADTTAGASLPGAQATIDAGGTRVLAAWNRHPEVIRRALGLSSRGLAAAVRRHAADEHVVLAHAARAAAVRTSTPTATARARTAAATYTGVGFDACSAPSQSAMAAWSRSPFRAIGVYIGGVNAACAQPNLTPAWVRRETAAGWHLILTYVGLQAPANSCGCASITAAKAASQGAAAAADAAGQAAALGIARGNPVYFDMEAYTRTTTNTRAVLAFLSAWTAGLHAAGMRSGVYSSAASGIADLVAQDGSGYREPDDIWFAVWDDVDSTATAYIPDRMWAGSRRIHQYAGDHTRTYGGVTLHIDSDYVDAETAVSTTAPTMVGTSSPSPMVPGTVTASQPVPDGALVEVEGTAAVFRIVGGAPLLVRYWHDLGGEQPFSFITQAQFASLAPVPANGTFAQDSSGAVYRFAGGFPFPVANRALLGAPASPVTIDVWDIQNVADPLSHLNRWPAVGTVIRGVPSGRYWVSRGVTRTLASARGSATRIEDASLAPWPAAPCVVPRLTGRTLAQVRAALMRSDCVLGRIRRLGAGQRLRHVRAQSPRAGTVAPALRPVAVTLG